MRSCKTSNYFLSSTKPWYKAPILLHSCNFVFILIIVDGRIWALLKSERDKNGGKVEIYK